MSTSPNKHTYRIFSWNVNGLRAVLRKNALQPFIADFRPDILCLQETKAQPGQATFDLPDYTEYWHSAERRGYSGTAIFTKPTPIRVERVGSDELNTSDLADSYGDPLHEGRILTAEYPELYLVTVYTPNSKPDLSRLPLREQLWDPAFLQYLKRLEQTKPVVVCGDFNAAHTAIDLARPKTNTRSAGFTPAERQGITNLINQGFIDTFRILHPNEQRYTWWSHWARARENNVGWRIDYFFISSALRPYLKSADIHDQVTGSDHCPISITLDFTNSTTEEPTA